MVRPTTINLEDIKTLIASKLEVTEFLDIIGWTMYDLVEEIDEAVIEDNFEELLAACD